MKKCFSEWNYTNEEIAFKIKFNETFALDKHADSVNMLLMVVL